MNNFYTKSEGNALANQVYNTRRQISILQRELNDLKYNADLLKKEFDTFKNENTKIEVTNFICNEE